jgi:hypothetical protein
MRRLALRLAVLTTVAAAAVFGLLAVERVVRSRAQVPAAPERHPATRWAPCNRNAGTQRPSTFTPLSDGRAAARVTHQREIRPYNARPFTVAGVRYGPATTYVPTDAELQAFRRARTSLGQPVLELNPYLRFVDGRDGLPRPSTDDLIQWSAHKWGIPEDWLRAEFVQESQWNQFQLGDELAVSAAWYDRSPPQARVPGGKSVYTSLGITQVKWIPDGSVGPGTEPLRWKSVAFNLDYQAATLRLYYDDPGGARTAWGDGSYVPCQAWKSVGGWFQPYPWNNGAQQAYVAQVKQHLSRRSWATTGFVRWTPASFPPGVTFSSATP